MGMEMMGMVQLGAQLGTQPMEVAGYPELVQVPVMTKKLEAALSAQAKSLGKRGGGDAASEQPDRL